MQEAGLRSTSCTLIYDAIGSVTNLSDDTGSSVTPYEYDAYGNVLASSGDAGNTYQFSSKEFEDHAGLIYFGARYYDPEIGRWLTPDPLGFIDGPNVYVYVSNNPLNLIDPLGFAGEKRSGRYLTRQKDLLRRQQTKVPSLGSRLLDGFTEDSILGSADEAFGTKISLAISTAKTGLDIIATLKDDHPNLDNFEKTKLISAQIGGNILTITGSVGGGAIGLIFSGGNPIAGIVVGFASGAVFGITVADDINNLRQRYYTN